MIKWNKYPLNSQKIYRSADMMPKLTKIPKSIPTPPPLPLPPPPSTSAQAMSLYESDSSKAIFHTMRDVKASLRYLFKTNNLATFCIGNCENAMETVLANLINCNDTILIGMIGETGKQAVSFVRQIGAKVHVLRTHVGKALDIDDIEIHLKMTRSKILFLVHGESSTGVLQPLNKIGNLCHRYDCMLIVDVSNTIGTVDLPTDLWKIDVAYATSQKAFDGLNDLVPITMSNTGLTKLDKSHVHFRSQLHDLRHIAEIWLSNDDTEFIYSKFVHAPSLYSLRDRLIAIQNEQLHNVIDRRMTCSKRLQHDIENLIGLELFVMRDEHRLPSMIAICVPNRFSEHFFEKISTERFPLNILPGVGETMGLIIRIQLTSGKSTKKLIKEFIQKLYHTLQTMIPDYVKNPGIHSNVYY